MWREIPLPCLRAGPEGSTPPDRQAQAHPLAHDRSLAARDELLRIARTPAAALFGDNEFKARDRVRRVAAKAYPQRLAQQKTAPRAPE